jgi:hypothetical protein
VVQEPLRGYRPVNKSTCIETSNFTANFFFSQHGIITLSFFLGTVNYSKGVICFSSPRDGVSKEQGFCGSGVTFV